MVRVLSNPTTKNLYPPPPCKKEGQVDQVYSAHNAICHGGDLREGQITELNKSNRSIIYLCRKPIPTNNNTHTHTHTNTMGTNPIQSNKQRISMLIRLAMGDPVS